MSDFRPFVELLRHEEHGHGEGKRWEGRGYTCVACRHREALERALDRVNAALVELGQVAQSTVAVFDEFGDTLPRRNDD